MTPPSHFAERILAFVVRDPEWREAVIGDLREEYARQSARIGATRARRWHTQQSLRIACRYGTHRLLRRGTPPPRWLAIAAQEPGGAWTAGLSRDALYAWRAVAQRPALSGVIVLTLALALAANATTFSLLDAVVLRPYRFDGVDRLMAVASIAPGSPFYDRATVTRGDYRDWARDAKSVQQLAAFEWWQPNLSGIENPEQVPGFKVTAEFFDLLGASPRLGRTLFAEESEPGRHHRVVLGHALWTRRFASDPAIVGRTVRLDGEQYEVVGVAPEGFQIPLGAEVWAPISYAAAAWEDRRDRSLTPARRRNRTRFVLAAAQVSLTLAVLFGSGLLLSAADTAGNGALGFNKSSVLIAQVDLPERSYPEPQARRRVITHVLESMRAIPAVTEAGFTSHIPYGNANADREFRPEGEDVRESEVRRAQYRRSTPDYFAAMQIPVLRGRLFDDGDRPDTTAVAMVSSTLAQQHWPGGDPIGRRFKISATGEWITIVGVVGDVVHDWFARRPDRTAYRPLSQDAPFRAVFTVRTVGDPTALAGDLRRAVASADADLPIAEINSLENFIEDRVAGLLSIASSLGVVALVAFTLAVMGIYSLMAYLTSQRTQEIGVRMALGASWWQVIRLITTQALKITAAGLIVGAALSFALGRLMQSVLFGIVSTNLLQLVALAAGLATAALIAAYLPARRAARLDPTIALREY